MGHDPVGIAIGARGHVEPFDDDGAIELRRINRPEDDQARLIIALDDLGISSDHQFSIGRQWQSRCVAAGGAGEEELLLLVTELREVRGPMLIPLSGSMGPVNLYFANTACSGGTVCPQNCCTVVAGTLKLHWLVVAAVQ